MHRIILGNDAIFHGYTFILTRASTHTYTPTHTHTSNNTYAKHTPLTAVPVLAVGLSAAEQRLQAVPEHGCSVPSSRQGDLCVARARDIEK